MIVKLIFIPKTVEDYQEVGRREEDPNAEENIEDDVDSDKESLLVDLFVTKNIFLQILLLCIFYV